jgi:hypothetical protein
MKHALLALLFLACIGCEPVEPEPTPTPPASGTTPPSKASNIINKGPAYSSVNAFTNSGIANKIFPGTYYTLEKASAQKLQLGQRSLLDADYRFWDPSKCYLDYNQDGQMDMFAFLTNFKDAPYGSKFGKFLLVDDVFGSSPKLKFIDANRRFLPRLKTIDLNKDGVYEVLFSAEEDHELIDGTHGAPAPVQFVQISKNGDLVFKEIGEPVSIHGQGFGDVDNDGDIDIIVWRFHITNPNKEDLASMPILYLNNGSNSFSQTNSFTQFVGLDNLIPKMGNGFRKNYAATVVDLFDLDGDGNLDILASISHNQTFPQWEYNHTSTRIYWGNGTGFFDVEKRFTDLPVDYLQGLGIPNSTPVIPLGFTYLDYDKDGDFDVVTSSTPDYGGYVVQLCENKGNRTFQDVTKQKMDTYSSIFPRGTQLTGTFPNFYEMRIHDKDGDGDFDLVPDHVAIWDIWQFPIAQNLYWENTGGSFVLKK